jgi:hypothetical protein
LGVGAPGPTATAGAVVGPGGFATTGGVVAGPVAEGWAAPGLAPGSPLPPGVPKALLLTVGVGS